jgi:predicted nucleic acid-binding protein
LIVVDASAAIDYLANAGAHGEWARDTIASEVDVAAPDVVDLEVVSGLRNWLARGEVTRRQADAALSDFRDLAVLRYPSTSLLERIWELRSTLTPYDGAYVALSEQLEVPLVTADLRLARSHGHRAEIISPPA